MHFHIIHPKPTLAIWNPALASTQPLSWRQRQWLTIFTRVLKGFNSVTSRNCTIFMGPHWKYTTLTAPRQRLNHTHPRSAACAIDSAKAIGPPAVLTAGIETTRHTTIHYSSPPCSYVACPRQRTHLRSKVAGIY